MITSLSLHIAPVSRLAAKLPVTALVKTEAIPGIRFQAGVLLIDDQVAVVKQVVENLLIAKCTVGG